MKQLLQSDLTKTLLYFTLTLLVTAALAPWPYNAGKMIAEIAESRKTSTAVQNIAAWCAMADFAHFFALTLFVCALVFAGPFICWLRVNATGVNLPVKPWSLHFPRFKFAESGQPLLHNPHRIFHWVTGFLLAGSLLALMTWLFLLTDWFAFEQPVDWLPALARAFSAAVLLSILTEWIFRGVLLGMLLRSLRPGLAILGISMLYGCLHFLFPMDRFHITDAGNADAGFRFILEMTAHLSSYLGDALGFITLIFSGLILCYTRYRTASLSLSIGLQTGWLFVFFLSHDIIAFTHANLGKLEAMIRPDRRSGFVPLLFVVATGLLVHVFIQISERKAKNT